jgi:hypothetical protein
MLRSLKAAFGTCNTISVKYSNRVPVELWVIRKEPHFGATSGLAVIHPEPHLPPRERVMTSDSIRVLVAAI